MDSLWISTRAPGVAQVTMARPAVFNAFDEAMIGELDAAFAQLEADTEVRVIVLASEGKHFSAGADLQWMQRASEASLEWNVADARRFAGMLARIERCPKPTVARVQGAALGGGAATHTRTRMRQGTPLHYVSAVAFSPSSGYITIGNDRGKALLYRLKHYQAS